MVNISYFLGSKPRLNQISRFCHEEKTTSFKKANQAYHPQPLILQCSQDQVNGGDLDLSKPLRQVDTKLVHHTNTGRLRHESSLDPVVVFNLFLAKMQTKVQLSPLHEILRDFLHCFLLTISRPQPDSYSLNQVPLYPPFDEHGDQQTGVLSQAHVNKEDGQGGGGVGGQGDGDDLGLPQLGPVLHHTHHAVLQ